jgi:hypothetical protein
LATPHKSLKACPSFGKYSMEKQSKPFGWLFVGSCFDDILTMKEKL